MASEELVLGVDVGGTKVAVAAMRDGEVAARAERPTVLTSSSALLDGLEQTAREAIAGSAEPMAVGVGVPSQIDYDTGTVETSVNIPLTGVPCARSSGAASACPSSSTTTPTWPRWRRRACSSCDELVMLTLGTGVGGGVVTGGRIFRGANGLGAELGHFTLMPDGPPCPGNCPNSGCVEAYCSGQALERDATELARDKPGSRLAEALGEDGRVSGRELVKVAEEGDPDAAAPVRALRPHARRGDRGLRERLRARARRDRRRALARVPPVPRPRGPGGGRAGAARALPPGARSRSPRAGRTPA